MIPLVCYQQPSFIACLMSSMLLVGIIELFIYLIILIVFQYRLFPKEFYPEISKKETSKKKIKRINITMIILWIIFTLLITCVEYIGINYK